MRGAQLASIFRNLSGLFGNATSTPKDSSEIKTSFIHMKLDHATGSMDGQILQGRFQGEKISALSLGLKPICPASMLLKLERSLSDTP